MNKHGGARPGAGRPALGKVKKSVYINPFIESELYEIQECYSDYEWTLSEIVEMAITNMHRQLIREKCEANGGAHKKESGTDSN